jgi:hypothetical protein
MFPRLGLERAMDKSALCNVRCGHSGQFGAPPVLCDIATRVFEAKLLRHEDVWACWCVLALRDLQLAFAERIESASPQINFCCDAILMLCETASVHC